MKPSNEEHLSEMISNSVLHISSSHLLGSNWRHLQGNLKMGSSRQNDYTSFYLYDSDSEPEPRLCVTGCGFYAGAYSNLCSKCSQHFKKLAELEEPLFIPLSATITSDTAAISEPPVQHPTRCISCNKKFGLMGFKCKCGKTFCGIHRYPETHECEFDFKGEGRHAIGKANPVLKPEKVEKI